MYTSEAYPFVSWEQFPMVGCDEGILDFAVIDWFTLFYAITIGFGDSFSGEIF